MPVLSPPLKRRCCMATVPEPVTRRDFLAASTAGAVLPLAVSALAAQAPAKAADNEPTKPVRPRRLAAINSIYRLRSHAYAIVNRLVFGYPVDGFHHQPPFQIVRMFNDQYPKDDLSRDFCKRHD